VGVKIAKKVLTYEGENPGKMRERIFERAQKIDSPLADGKHQGHGDGQ